MKSLKIFILLLLASCFLFKTETNSKFLKSKNKDNQSIISLNNILTPKVIKHKKILKPIGQSIFWEGWIRYFKYSGSTNSRPSNFFKNPYFLKQKLLKIDLTKKDQGGFVFIPGQFEFYAILTKDQFNILSSRSSNQNEIIVKNVDVLRVENILPIKEKKIEKKSVYDLGTFQEGKCFQVYTNKPYYPNQEFNNNTDKGIKEKWIICLDKQSIKDTLITNLILLKERQQEETDKLEIFPKNSDNSTFERYMTAEKSIEKRKDSQPKDGYWILLQDWTGCSLKCGGGKSFQHWMCIPPKKGGRSCEGEAIRQKSCNTQPCPGTIEFPLLSLPKKESLYEIKKPIIKSLPISSRPQNFIKCQIKENDVFYINRKESKNKIPGRIIMNNRSISLFSDEAYKNNIFSFNLKETEITKNTADSCCFNLESGIKIFTICGGFGQRCGGGLKTFNFVEEWFKDFNIFKISCFNKLKEYNWKIEEAKKAMEDSNNESGLVDIEDRSNLLRKKLEEKESQIMMKKTDKTQQLAYQALKREFDIEKMIKLEVQQKAIQETKYLLEQKTHEEKKQDALEKIFKEREREEERKRNRSLAKLEIEKIKEEVKRQIIMKRLALRNNIKKIIQKANRRKRFIENEIRTIRRKIAQNLADANKIGNIDKCELGLKSKESRKNYCKENINDNYSRNNECLQQSSFCYICCENEFGNMVMQKRDECYNMCDKTLEKMIGSGTFVWKD